MYNIFNVEHTVYDREGISEIVLKIQKLNQLIDKSDETATRLVEVHEANFKKQTAILLIATKRKGGKIKDSISKIKERKDNLTEKKKIEIENKKLLLNRKWSREIDKLKMELFNRMSKIVVKNILNYNNLAFNSPVTNECLDKDELQAECWIIMENCIEKFVPKYCFYFYFNKSLSRNLYRMFIKTVQKREKYQNYSVEHLSTTELYTKSGNQGLELLIEQLNLGENEEKILRSKLNNEKKADFLEENEGWTSGKYYATLKRVKKVILKLKEDGEF